MRNLINALLATVLFAPAIVQAQLNAETVFCGECRDPVEYPDDYVNFAFNQVYGETGWMDLDQADDFFIENSNGDRVYVDVDFVMHSSSLLGINLPIWPKNLLEITLALPNGQLYKAVRSIFVSPLPVPHSSDPEPADPDPDNDSGNDGVDDPEGEQEPDPEDEEEWGPVGFTDIQDPDENGEFPPADWCEEC